MVKVAVVVVLLLQTASLVLGFYDDSVKLGAEQGDHLESNF